MQPAIPERPDDYELITLSFTPELEDAELGPGDNSNLGDPWFETFDETSATWPVELHRRPRRLVVILGAAFVLTAVACVGGSAI